MEDKETLYARWLNNEITEGERQSLKEEGVIDDLEKIIKTTDTWHLPKYNKLEGLKQLKSKQLSSKHNPNPSYPNPSYPKLLAGISVGVLLILALFNYFGKTSEVIILADKGHTEDIKLIDGSILKVNDGSTITYDKDTWSQKRNVELTGEAFFEVTKGSPFVVETPHGSITVLGTQFNVRSWGSRLYVECYEGSVKVKANNGQTILTESEAVYVINGVMQENKKIAYRAPSWTHGSSRFQDENINEVFAEMERQYNIKIKIKATDKTQTFSGAFEHDNLVNALENICKPLGLQFTISENKKEVIVE